MKEYKKPVLYAESYELAEHISATCQWQTNFGNQCPIIEGPNGGVVFFTATPPCNEDGVSAIDFHYGKGFAKDATVEDLIGMNIQCYNSLQDYHNLYTS